MLHVEGGTAPERLKILRHEVGHAIDHAYRLSRRRAYREAFGWARPYPDAFRPKPFSQDHVLHLDAWYAQSHPAEDFAETFAVWLAPGARWRRRYAGWPALKKLECVDRMMAAILPLCPPVRSRAVVEPLSSLRTTLREHYDEKQRRYGREHPDVYDLDLQRLFSPAGRSRRPEPAARFLARRRADLRREVSEASGLHPYAVDQVLSSMIGRARDLRLVRDRPERAVRADAIARLVDLALDDVRGGRRRYAL
jgi:hypothetical protein